MVLVLLLCHRMEVLEYLVVPMGRVKVSVCCVGGSFVFYFLLLQLGGWCWCRWEEVFA